MISCKRCGISFDFLYKLEKHFNNKLPCKPILSSMSIDDLKKDFINLSRIVIKDDKKFYKCKYCKKLYLSASSKCSHQKKCKEVHTSKNNYMNHLVDASNAVVNNNNNTVNNNDNSVTNIVNNVDNSVTNQVSNQFSNNIFINIGKDNFSVDGVNNLINSAKLNNKIKSFPTYSIGHILDDNFKLLKSHMYRCQKEDKNPQTGHRSHYNFALELFKEIMNSTDYRTKNAFIAEVTDNVAYCFLDGQFYSISLEDFFNIVFQHFHVLFKKIIKIKDNYNGFSADDKEYVDFTYLQFKDYLDHGDKMELKQEIINSLYKNKEILQELLNSAVPIDKFKNLDKKTLNFNSNLVNKLRKKYALEPISNDLNESININDKELLLRDRDSSKIGVNLQDKYDVEIKLKEKTVFKVTPNGYKLYKASYKGIDILYDIELEVGLIECSEKKEIIEKELLCKYIDKFINFSFLDSDDYITVKME